MSRKKEFEVTKSKIDRFIRRLENKNLKTRILVGNFYPSMTAYNASMDDCFFRAQEFANEIIRYGNEAIRGRERAVVIGNKIVMIRNPPVFPDYVFDQHIPINETELHFFVNYGRNLYSTDIWRFPEYEGPHKEGAPEFGPFESRRSILSIEY